LEFVDQSGQRAFRPAQHRRALVGEITAVGGLINPCPKLRQAGGDEAVTAADEIGESWGAEQAGIADAGDGSRGIKREAQIAGGAVVPFAESGGDDEDARCGGHGGARQI